jgi:glutamyl-tRNA synthetase
MKLRFAPSPTGHLHVGGARTAIFNLLHARRHGGSLVLRIEDTDVERSKQHHAEQILSSMEWLGIEWDEGPHYQSDRLDRYRQRVGELLDQKKAYRCYCTPEDLEQERASAEAGGAAFLYSGRCGDRSDAPGNAPDNAPSVVRLRIPPGRTELRDLIRGEVSVDNATLDDFILLRTDGNPTYHLSVVVDDIDMGITVVARGEDHLSNTPKHIHLFRAFDYEPPLFAHLPLILGSDRKRLSKRTGAASVEELRAMGILPEALFNFLILLGWSPGEDREQFSREEAEAEFDLSEVHLSAAIFDYEKLLWLNGLYLSSNPIATVMQHLQEHLSFPVDDLDRLERIVELHRTRPRTLVDLAGAIRFYFVPDDAIEYEPQAAKKHLKGEDLPSHLQALLESYGELDPWTIESTEQTLRSVAESAGVSAGKLIHPLRLAVTGSGASPPIFDVLVEVGRERTISRLERLIERMSSER